MGACPRQSPAGSPSSEFTVRVHPDDRDTGYTIRQAAYDLRDSAANRWSPTRTDPRYPLDRRTAGTIAALLLLREHVIAPILASVRIMGRIPITHLYRVDRDYQKSRIDRLTLFAPGHPSRRVDNVLAIGVS